MLENLSLFVRFSQFFSLLPYFIERHPQSKRFKKISFSWKKMTTWWFIIVSIVQLVFFIWRILTSWRFSHEEGVSQMNLPPIFALVVPTEALFVIVMTLLSRYVVSKYSHLHRAQSYIKMAHKSLGMGKIKLTDGQAVKRKTIFGLIWAAIASLVMVVSSFQQFSVLAKTEGTASTLIVQFSWLFSFMNLMLFNFFMYLSYFIVSRYIRLITVDLKTSIGTSKNHPKISETNIEEPIRIRHFNHLATKPPSRKDILKHAKRTFGYLCAALTELNAVFSFPSFFFLLTRLFLSAVSLYVSIYGLMSDNKFLARMMQQTVSFCVVGFFNILLILHSADLPINQVKLLRETIYSFSLENSVSEEEESEAFYFIQCLSDERIRLSALGVFQVGMHQLPSISASIVTYLIVLLQANLA